MINYDSWIEKTQLKKDLKASGSRVVLFAADWCGYCRRFISMLKSFDRTGVNARNLIIANIDSEDGSLWEDYQIDLVPTIIVFKDGKETFRRNGRPGIGLQEKDLEEALKAA
jgi:thioredoxin 1